MKRKPKTKRKGGGGGLRTAATHKILHFRTVKLNLLLEVQNQLLCFINLHQILTYSLNFHNESQKYMCLLRCKEKYDEQNNIGKRDDN
jgi:hypothetical protein